MDSICPMCLEDDGYLVDCDSCGTWVCTSCEGTCCAGL